MPTLPTNEDGSLRPFTADEYDAFGLKRRGVTGEGDHIITDLGPDGSGCTRRFFCNWNQRFNAAIYFVGAVKKLKIAATASISRLLPQRDPVFPNWVATKVRISPYRFTGEIEATGETIADGASPTKEANPSFTLAALDVTYEMVPFDLATDAAVAGNALGEQLRYVTWPGFPGADASTDASYIGLPGGILRYVTTDGTTATGPAGTAIPFSVGFVEGTKKFKIVWRRVPEDVWSLTSGLFVGIIGTETARGYIGSVNQEYFQGYPPLSLQLLGVEERLLPDPTGLGYSWDLAYIFSYKPVPYGQLGFYFHDTKTSGAQSGYYQVLRPAAGAMTKDASAIGDNDSLFHVKDFADLFNPGAFIDPS
jgi:hypothetical protein